MLSARKAALLGNQIAEQLKAVGDGLMPHSSKNTEKEAWDFYIGSKIEKYGKGLKDKAKAAAIKAGVLFDHEKKPLAPGFNDTVYLGDVLEIKCQVKQPSVTVDGKAFYDALIKAGFADTPLNSRRIEALYLAAHKTSRPAHTFTAELLVE